MIYAFTSGKFSFMDSDEYMMWADRDDTPVSARNYAHDLFVYDGNEDEERDWIIEDLNDFFGPSGWHVSGEHQNVAEADDTTSAWPFVVRRQVVLIEKFYGPEGWQEKPFAVPFSGELMAPLMEPTVFQDCNA